MENATESTHNSGASNTVHVNPLFDANVMAGPDSQACQKK